MGEFSVNPPVDVNKALYLLQARHSRLNTDQFIEKLVTSDDKSFGLVFLRLPQLLHRYLFKDILSNAGSYRKQTDKDGGRIFFGPDQKFRGAPPEQIENGIQRACSNLSREDSSPLFNVTKFYQQFVYIHPFYDANGRIGRFITDVYLNFHGIYFPWETLHQNTKWIKKINDCHNRFDTQLYDKYIEILSRHFEKCIFRKEKIDPETIL